MQVREDAIHRVLLLALSMILFMMVLSNDVRVSTVHAESSDVPWIYYYSLEHDGFVIERADSTESRFWVEGVNLTD